MACRYAGECLTGILGCDCEKAAQEAEDKKADLGPEAVYDRSEPDDEYYLGDWLGEFDDDPDLWNKGARE